MLGFYGWVSGVGSHVTGRPASIIHVARLFERRRFHVSIICFPYFGRNRLARPAERPASPTCLMTESPRKGSLLVVFLTVFIDLLGFGIVLPLLPIYAKTFPAVDRHGILLGLLMASFSAMQFLCAPVWGRLSDRIGRRPVLMIGLAGSAVFYSLFALATLQKSLVMMFVARIGAGIAGATISTAQAYIADTTSLEKRPKGMALIGMAFGLGFTVGPLIGLLAVPTRDADPTATPGFVAAGLSAFAFVLAVFMLPESRKEGSQSSERELLDFRAFRGAMSIPSVSFVLASMFVCVFSFANFETTLSMLINGERADRMSSPFSYSWAEVCWTFSYIGLILLVVQGGFVRPLAGRIHEGTMAAAGALMQVVAFLLVTTAISRSSNAILWTALTIIVAGFSFMQPSLSSLLSRRSDPEKQGAILGVGQSVNSMARILGSFVGIPLLSLNLSLPYWVASGMMLLGAVLVVIAARTGEDYGK